MKAYLNLYTAPHGSVVLWDSERAADSVATRDRVGILEIEVTEGPDGGHEVYVTAAKPGKLSKEQARWFVLPREKPKKAAKARRKR